MCTKILYFILNLDETISFCLKSVALYISWTKNLKKNYKKSSVLAVICLLLFLLSVRCAARSSRRWRICDYIRSNILLIDKHLSATCVKKYSNPSSRSGTIWSFIKLATASVQNATRNFSSRRVSCAFIFGSLVLTVHVIMQRSCYMFLWCNQYVHFIIVTVVQCV